MSVRVQDTILPKNDADFPVVDSGNIRGGHHEVANAAARDALSAAMRSVGMKVVTQDDGKTWQLDSNSTTWTEFTGGGGGGFTAGGDLTGTSTNQTVAKIQGVPSPDPTGPVDGRAIELHEIVHPAIPSPVTVNFESPYISVSDGTHLYVSQYPTYSSVLWKLTIVGGTITAAVSLDLSVAAGHPITVHDMDQDATYLYVACFDDTTVAIVDKATFTIAGWATLPLGNAHSVCTDGTNIYVTDPAATQTAAFLVGDLLGQPYGNAVVPTVTNAIGGRMIRFGGGKLWLIGGGAGPAIRRLDPTTLLSDGLITNIPGKGLCVLYDSINSIVWVGGSESAGSAGGYVWGVGPTDLQLILGGTIDMGRFWTQDGVVGLAYGPNPLAPTHICAVARNGSHAVVFDPLHHKDIVSLTPHTDGGSELTLYGSVAGIGTYFYMPASKDTYGLIPGTRAAIDYINTTDSSVGTVSTPAATPVPSTWDLRYSSPGGDVTGTISSNTVAKIQGVTSMDPTGTLDHDVIELRDLTPRTRVVTLLSPDSLISDGAYLYVGQFSQGLVGPGTNLSTVWKFTLSPGGNQYLTGVAADLNAASGLSNIMVRDIQQDPAGGPYLYASCWTNRHIAIIRKADMAVVGWFYASAANRIATACSDGTYVYAYDPNNGTLYKFQISSGVGQTYGTAAAPLEGALTISGRWVTYGNGKIWLATAGKQASAVIRIDPTTMTDDGLTSDILDNAMFAFYDPGSNAVWAGGNAGNTPTVWRLNPSTIQSTHTFANGPNKTQYHSLCTGPSDTGTPDAWIYASNGNVSQVAAINPSANTFHGPYTTNPSNTSFYEGIAAVGSEVFAAAYNNGSKTVSKEIDTLNATTLAVGVFGPYTPPQDLRLRYIPIDGDVLGPLNQNQVQALQGAFVSPPTTADIGNVPTLGHVNLWPGMNTITWDGDKGVIWVGERLPITELATVSLYAYDPVLAHTKTYLINSIGNRGIRKVVCTPTHVFIALNFTSIKSAPLLLILDRATMTPLGGGISLVGQDPVGACLCTSPYDIVVVGDTIYVADMVAGVLAFSLNKALAAGTSGVAPEAATRGVGHVWSIAYDGEFVWASDQSMGRIRKLESTTLIVYDSLIPPSTPYQLLMANGKLWCAASSTVLMIDTVLVDYTAWVSTPFPAAPRLQALTYDNSIIWASGISTGELPDNRLFLTNQTTGDFVGVYTPPQLDVYGATMALTTDGTSVFMAVDLVNNASNVAGVTGYNPILDQEVLRYTGPFNLAYAPAGGGGTLVGDVTGAIGSNTVVQIQNRAVNAAVPSTGQPLTWSGADWAPADVSQLRGTAISNPLNIYGAGTTLWWNGSAWDGSAAPLSTGALFYWNGGSVGWGFLSGGDLTGTFPTWTVAKLQGRTVASTGPTNGQVLTWNNGTTQWEPQTPSGGSGPLAPGLYSARPAAGTAGRRYTTTDGPVEYVDDGAVWHPMIEGRMGTQVKPVLPANTNWLANPVTGQARTLTDVGGCVQLFVSPTSSSDIQLLERAGGVPGTSRITAHLRVSSVPTGGAFYAFDFGLYYRDSSTGHFRGVGWKLDGSYVKSLICFAAHPFTAGGTPNVIDSTDASWVTPEVDFGDIWVRLDWSGFNLRMDASRDGVSWVGSTGFGVGVTSLGWVATADRCGVFLHNQNSPAVEVLLDSWDET